jgi:hypothetical protein
MTQLGRFGAHQSLPRRDLQQRGFLMTKQVFGKNVRSTECPDCQGTGFRNRVRCQRCEGTGKLYMLATSAADASRSQSESDCWLTAAMLASALGKDPLDAAVLTAITGSAPLGILLADEESKEPQPAPEGDAPASNASPKDDGSVGGNDDATSSEAPDGGDGD